MKIKSTLTPSSGSSYYIPLSEKEATTVLTTIGKRVLCIINGKASIHCVILRS